MDEEKDEFWEPAPEDFLPSPTVPQAKIYRIPKRQTSYQAALFLVFCFSVSLLTWRSQGGLRLGISYNCFFLDGEYWRAFSALLVHADLGHFLSNGWLLFLFGWFLRDLAGVLAFPFLSILIGMVTNVLTVMTMPQGRFLVGASGMVYGMVGLWLVLFFRYTPLSLGQRLLRSIGFVLLMLFPSTFRPEVSYMAHGIGFFLGVFVGVVFVLSPLGDAIENQSR